MRRNDEWIGGAVLVIIGVALLLGQWSDNVGRFVLLGIGIGLLVLFAATRNPGTLIGGGICTGLGVGVLIATEATGEIGGAAVLLGLAGGFFFVWLVGLLFRLEATRFWPLIPGAILGAIGLVVLAGSQDAEAYKALWPIVLIAIGVIVLVAAIVRPRGTPPAPPGV